MKTLIILLIVAGIACGAYFYLGKTHHQVDLQRAGEQASKRAEELKDTVKDKLKDASLSVPDIKQELERTGKVVRRKAQAVGSAIADAAGDARVTGTIKAKFVKDPNLSAFRISVSTTD